MGELWGTLFWVSMYSIVPFSGLREAPDRTDQRKDGGRDSIQSSCGKFGEKSKISYLD